MKIAKNSAFNSYPNLYEWTKISLDNAQSDDLRSLIRSHNALYEKEQAKFLSKFYNGIKANNLRKQVGKH